MLAFDRYVSYMENGPEGEDDLEDEVIKPAFLHLENNYSNDEQEQVIKTTRQLLQDFYTTFDRARLSLAQDARHALDETLKQYSEQLDFIATYNGLYIIDDTLLRTYAKDGREAAINSIPQLLPAYEHNKQLEAAIKKISEYYNKRIALYDIYAKYGCIRNGSADIKCVSSIFDPESQQLINYNEMIITAITPEYNSVIKTFQNSTADIKKKLESI